MKSPFPGMDPFIEGCGLWRDFHPHLIDDIYRYLADTLPPRYSVLSGERNYVVLENTEGSKHLPFFPDVSVLAPSNHEADAQSEESIAVAEPAHEGDEFTMLAYVEEEFRETFVEIYEDGPEDRLVTSIELLSPSNKKANSEGWDKFLRKRQGLLQGGAANIVEIDLLRGGQRMPMANAWPNCPFVFLTARIGSMPYCKVRCADLRKPLPLLRVPLLKPDSDVMIDLQPMITTIYARSRYYRRIDYTKPIKPLLSESELAWLQERLQGRE